MKLQSLYLHLLIAAMLSGCVSGNVTSKPTPTFPTSMLLTPTLILSPVSTVTSHPIATLEPEQAKDAIRTLLQNTSNCESPCIWGIIPGQTMLGDTQNIFTHLAIPLVHTNTRDGKEFYSVTYNFDNGLGITPTFTIQNNIVKNISLIIIPETRQPGVPKNWQAYSPEVLINKYGQPSKVDFLIGQAPSFISYSMVMYFEVVDLIVEYHGNDLGGEPVSPKVCPLTDKFNIIRVWLGPNPEHPPFAGVPLEDAASMNLEEFSERMIGNLDSACINLKEEMLH